MKQVLVIEDDDQARKLIQRVLEQAGYTTALASDGREGLRLYQKRPADLVITDLIMPNQEGLETIMALKRQNTAVKIIAVSGGGRMDPACYLNTAKQAGALKTFAKPFNNQALLQAVDDLIGAA